MVELDGLYSGVGCWKHWLTNGALRLDEVAAARIRDGRVRQRRRAELAMASVIRYSPKLGEFFGTPCRRTRKPPSRRRASAVAEKPGRKNRDTVIPGSEYGCTC